MAIIVGNRISNITNSTTVKTDYSGYVVHTFSTPGATTFSVTGTGTVVDVLVVGGGGAGAVNGRTNWAGGGGAGATLYSKNIPLVAGVSYPIIIGAGGLGPSSGAATTFTYNGGSITAQGGGFGGGPSGTAAGGPSPQASGGAGFPIGIGANVVGLGFPGQPAGGPGAPGGGGGAGSAGVLQGVGGQGVPYTITGSPIFYSGGGSGGQPLHPTSFPTMFGLGGSTATSTPGAAGNPGCVIIRYIG